MIRSDRGRPGIDELYSASVKIAAIAGCDCCANGSRGRGDEPVKSFNSPAGPASGGKQQSVVAGRGMIEMKNPPGELLRKHRFRSVQQRQLALPIRQYLDP